MPSFPYQCITYVYCVHWYGIECMVTVGQFEGKDCIVPTIPHSTMLAANSPLRYVRMWVYQAHFTLYFSHIYCLRVILTYSLLYNPATLLHTGHLIMYNIILVAY